MKFYEFENGFVDMWRGDALERIECITWRFCDCVYRGNCFIGGECVGDLECANSLDLKKWFPQLVFNWD